MAKAPVVLSLDSVVKQFPGSEIPAVNCVSVTLSQGELLGLLGPSGCGKTTLLRLIAGFEQPQRGEIFIAGQLVSRADFCCPPEARGVGMVFQDYALFPHLTTLENVAFGLRRQKRREPLQRAREMLALVGLESLERRYPHELSGGQQQRVALARALAPSPALVLLDEPLSNLDVQVRLKLRQEMREILRHAQTSAILVTHDQEEALSVCDRVAVMRQGSIEQEGSPDQLYSRPATRFVAEFITQANFLPTHWDGQAWQTLMGPFRPVNGDRPQPDSSEASSIMVRQENLRLEIDPDGSAYVRDRQFLGREYRYFLSFPDGSRLQARRPAAEPIPIGARARISLGTPRGRLYPGAQVLEWQPQAIDSLLSD